MEEVEVEGPQAVPFGNDQVPTDVRVLIPDQLWRALKLYAEEGIPTGHFLHAVLTNNLVESLGRADEESRSALGAIVQLLYNFAPGDCWGSCALVTAWLQTGGLAGKRDGGTVVLSGRW